MTRGTVKAAELASGLGAVVLGGGLGALMPRIPMAYAIAVLVSGILVHGTGMTLKHRLESASRPPLWWEQALFWMCWVLLGVAVAWLGARIAAS
jgi:hypothetical protein